MGARPGKPECRRHSEGVRSSGSKEISGGAGSFAEPVSGRQFPAIREKLKFRRKNSRKVALHSYFRSIFPRVTREFRFHQNREYLADKQGFKSAFQGNNCPLARHQNHRLAPTYKGPQGLPGSVLHRGLAQLRWGSPAPRPRTGCPICQAATRALLENLSAAQLLQVKATAARKPDSYGLIVGLVTVKLVAIGKNFLKL